MPLKLNIKGKRAQRASQRESGSPTAVADVPSSSPRRCERHLSRESDSTGSRRIGMRGISSPRQTGRKETTISSPAQFSTRGFFHSSSWNTRLHVALNDKDISPKDLIELIQSDGSSLIEPNDEGRLPLHVAVCQHHPVEVVTALVEAYPSGIKMCDYQGCTPIDYALQAAKKGSLPLPSMCSWVSPTRDGDIMEWQAHQMCTWSIVRLLLFTSASHAGRSLLIEKGQPYLLEALIHAAPPPVISLLAAASSELLDSGGRGTAFASSAMYLCISRQYPASVLKNLAQQCPPDVRLVKDETGMGLVAAQYLTGCYKRDEDGEWCEQREYMKIMKRCINKGYIDDTASPQFLEWWTKLALLVEFCHHGQLPSPKYRLHAALANPDTPPMVTRMFAALHPDSVVSIDASSGRLPLHLAVRTAPYLPRKYESSARLSESTIDMMVRLGTDLVRCRYENRLPLHHAIVTGKNWLSFKSLLVTDRKMLGARDPVTKLFPFQLAALFRHSAAADSFLIQRARNIFSYESWSILSAKRRQVTVEQIKRLEDSEWLTTIYELLRRYPRPVKSGIPKQEVKEARDSTGMGMVAAHYSVWCYDKERQMPKSEHIKALRHVILHASVTRVPPSLFDEFDAWWTKMKFWIWYCYCGELKTNPILASGTSLPQTDDYLLHAALSNSDTPPQVVHLLLRLYPQSVMLVIPGTDVLPLHIAASTTEYTRRSFELDITKPATSLVSDLYPEAIRQRNGDRLPIHLAIDAHKTWNELVPLVDFNGEALKCRDRLTGLFPFQQIALSKAYSSDLRLRFQHLARNSMTRKDWKQPSKKRKVVKWMQSRYEIDKLASIYLLLRAKPSVLSLSSAPLMTINSNREKDQLLNHAVFVGNTAGSTIQTGSPYSKPSQDSDVPSTALSDFLAGHTGTHSDNETRSALQGDASVFSTMDIMMVLSVTDSSRGASQVEGIVSVPCPTKAPGAVELPKDFETVETDVNDERVVNWPSPLDKMCSTLNTAKEKALTVAARGSSKQSDDAASVISGASSRLVVHRSGWSKPVHIPKKKWNMLRHAIVKRPEEAEMRCLRCDQRKRDVLMLPCRHLCLCARCSVSVPVAQCLTCGKAVTDQTVIYL